MGYMHIENLYKVDDILNFRTVYAMEKLHGASAHVALPLASGPLRLFCGGVGRAVFEGLFDLPTLREYMAGFGLDDMTIYGEAYGGKCQGMKGTYGPALRFVCFDVRIGKHWLCVPAAEEFVRDLGLEFVPYEIVVCDMASLDAARMKPSVQAERNGMGSDKQREGIVIRPLQEYTRNNGSRVMAKYKNEAFSERKNAPPPGASAEKIRLLTDAQAIADEWVTEMRLSHILGKEPLWCMGDTGRVIAAMIEDIAREAGGEIEMTKEAKGRIGRATALMFKRRLVGDIEEGMR